ncbi:TolC family outer membrane protein [Thioalkalivibrio sp. XN279]|uniref:TolC family outer membrane protein n=1 Tax=Thioalkalivibrio sp. XN279 TaxID=2714953 RepID=UPI00140B79D8|nr:TolC family outer membrane protein [Thioalkalivibrio sp. XN279]NHA16136.1 TolC family outer membrane protein [Thioalkalivibrio sp. XN279]
MKLNSLYSLLAALALLASSQAGATSLFEAYRDALRSDPTLREAAANRSATLEAKPQARAALLPQIEATGSYQHSSSSGTQTFTQRLESGQVVTLSSGFRQEVEPLRNWQLRVTQTLFRWDQWVALRQADKELARAEAEFRAAEQDLMARVANRYFEILGARATLEAAEAAREAIGRQLEQAEKRFEVGLSAITDVQEAQASFDAATAGVIEAKRTYAVAREFLREITGVYYDDLADAGPDTPLVSPEPDDVDEWVQTALSRNLSLEAARIAADISRDNISLQRSGHYPALELFATRGNSRVTAERQDSPVVLPGDPDPGPQPFLPADSDSWQDAYGVQVRVPIYSGGAVSAGVREATYRHEASQQQLERVARQTERAARDAYLSVTSEISRVEALTQAVESAQTALRATEAGFEVGTRTTVDVLQSRRQLFEAQRDLANSRYTYLVNALLLKQAAGTLQEADIREIDGWLKPADQVPTPSQPAP